MGLNGLFKRPDIVHPRLPVWTEILVEKILSITHGCVAKQPVTSLAGLNETLVHAAPGDKERGFLPTDQVWGFVDTDTRGQAPETTPPPPPHLNCEQIATAFQGEGGLGGRVRSRMQLQGSFI